MSMLIGRRFLQLRRLYAVGILTCFSLFGLVLAAHGQTDRVIQLIGKLRKPDGTVNRDAAEALGKFNDRRATEPLIAALKAESHWDCSPETEALGKIKDPRAVEPLIAIMNDKANYFMCREDAAKALGKIKDPHVIEPLIAAFADFNVSEDAEDALVEIGTTAVQPLIEALDHENIYVPSALGRIRDPRAITPLIAILKNRGNATPYGDPHIGPDEASTALFLIGKPAVEPLIAALKDDNVLVRLKAAWALGEIGDPRAVEPLIAALSDPDSDVRERAAIALGTIGKPALEPLLSKLKDTDATVRMAAAKGSQEVVDGPNYQPIPVTRATNALLAALMSRDLAVIAGAYAFFVKQGKLDSEDTLIEALEKYGDDRMALRFIVCGNNKLESAGREWAKTHGYVLEEFREPAGGPSGGSQSVGWGSKK